MPGLTPKQQRFVEEYLVDLNATGAARRAGYSVRTANRMASENLSKPDIVAAIAEQRRQLSERAARTVDDVMADIRRRGKLAEDAGDFGPALKAAELEGKHLGAFVDRLELAGKNGAPIETKITVEYVRPSPAS